MVDIKGFQGEYRVLSNFYPCTVRFEELTFRSSEAAYQANKSSSKRVRQALTNMNAREARTYGRRIAVRPDWEEDKLNVMYRILRVKFTQNPDLRQKLLDTGNVHLEETNWWKDRFWGVYNGVGENHLGRLLMLVRDEIREGIID